MCIRDRFSPLKLKDYIIENKEDILLKASEIPAIIFETLDEIRSFSSNKNADALKANELEIQLSKQKNINRVFGIGIGIIVIIVIMLIVN